MLHTFPKQIMKLLGAQVTSDRFFQIIFHIVLWSIWIGLPIINSSDNERFHQFAIAVIPVTLTNIPLFLLNSEWLIPQVFRRRGLVVYLGALVALILGFATLQLFMKEWVVPCYLLRKHYDVFWAVVPALFVTAISTGYGFIAYLLQQEKKRQEEHQERLQSELSFLRSQISPHFIFNVLNSIVYLIRTRSAQAESVTIKLSELMRYMLYDSDDDQVPLDKEIGYLQNYVELQKVRFEEDVDIRLSIEGDPGPQLIEPMLMIPFVENAFKHGVGLVDAPFIEIGLVVSEKGVYFTVKNKIAPGTPEDKDPSHGIGIRNVRRRLDLLYPGKHRLDISHEIGFFLVELEIELSKPGAPGS